MLIHSDRLNGRFSLSHDYTADKMNCALEIIPAVIAKPHEIFSFDWKESAPQAPVQTHG
jgi:hypothetical protein